MAYEKDVEALTRDIIDDLKATSGYDFGAEECEKSETNGFSFQIDPIALLGLIVTPIVEHIVNVVRKRVSEGRRKSAPPLTEAEIQEIRACVLQFGANAKEAGTAIVKPDLARKMADSVERAVRRNPGLLLGRSRRV